MEDVLCPLESGGFAAVEQGHGVVERIAGRMDIAAFECRVVARRGKGATNHFLSRVVTGILFAQGLEEAGFLLGR